MQGDLTREGVFDFDGQQGPSSRGVPPHSGSIANGLDAVLVLGGRADLPGLNVHSDPALPCAAIFLMGPIDPSEFAAMARSMPDPAVPVAHFGDCGPMRSDFAADLLDHRTLAEARLRFAPIIRRLKAMPFQAAREDRSGLLILRLAYSRNCPIEANFAPGERTIIQYPLLSSQASARSELEGLAYQGLLRRRHFIRTHSCDHCGSLRLIAYEACHACGSSDLADEAIVHHYRCGCQAAESAFVAGARLTCPKCRRELRHLGIDYGKPGTIVHCRSCGTTSQEPDPVFVCLDCHATVDGRQAVAADWFHYELTELGMQSLREGRLPIGPDRRRPGDHQPSRSMRTCRLKR
jgi:ribosomal protein S27E